MDGILLEDTNKVLLKILEPGTSPKQLEAYHDFFKMLISEVSISHNMQNYARWLVNALKCYKDNDAPLLLDYILELAMFASKDETSLSMLKSEHFFVDLIKAINEPAQKKRIMYIKLIGFLASYQEELDWIMNSSALSDILILAKDEDCSIAQEGCSTIARLLEATASNHQVLCLKLVEVIIFPLTNPAANYRAQCEGVQVDLRCLVQVLESLIDNFSTEVLDIFVKKEIAHLCDNLSVQSENASLRMQLYRITMMLSFYELTQIFDGINIVKQNVIKIVGLPKLVLREHEKSNCLGIIDVGCYAQKYYCKMENRLPKYFYNGKILDLRNEFLLYKCSSISTIEWKLMDIPTMCRNFYENFARIKFWSHMSNQNSRETMIFLYQIKDLFFKTPLFETETIALNRILDARELYRLSEVCTIFRMLSSVLEDLLSHREKIQCLASYSFENEQQFVGALFDVLSNFAENFKLSWSDCLGQSDIIDLVLEWLSISESYQLTVSGLNLISVSLIKDISSNIALLGDSSNSSLAKLESLLYTKCTDERWEVRNASLNVLCSVTSKPSHDLVAMKNSLTSEYFSKMILKLAFDEKNCLVRAMTFRLIGGMVKCKETNDFTNDEFIDMVINTLKTATNNTLRKEIVDLLSEIYKWCGTIARSYKIYECILDIYGPHSCEELWQSIIKFWQSVVNKHLLNEGIEDGKFPAAIFSKEKKKIIVLTSQEIQNRLVKVLNNLSYTGCLAQICKTIEDENAPDAIFELACKIAKNLSNIFDLYGVTSITWSNNKESENYEDLLTLPAFMEESPVILEELDEIINDMMSNTSLKGESNGVDVNELDASLISDHLSPKEFLNLIARKQNLTKEIRSLQRFKTLIRKILESPCL